MSHCTTEQIVNGTCPRSGSDGDSRFTNFRQGFVKLIRGDVTEKEFEEGLGTVREGIVRTGEVFEAGGALLAAPFAGAARGVTGGSTSVQEAAGGGAPSDTAGGLTGPGGIGETTQQVTTEAEDVARTVIINLGGTVEEAVKETGDIAETAVEEVGDVGASLLQQPVVVAALAVGAALLLSK